MDSVRISIIITLVFLWQLDKAVLNLHGNSRNMNSQINFEKKKEGGFIPLNFKTYCEAVCCWCKNKYLDQWNRIENLEKDPALYVN